MPAVGSRSFSEYGMPSRGPRSSPRRARSSAARACRRARSAVTVRYALSRGLSRSMRASAASQSSTGESARARISRPSSVAGVKQSSVASTRPPSSERRLWGYPGGLRQRGRQVGGAHQVRVDSPGRAATLGDGPDDQRLTPLHVAAGEDAGHARHPVGVAPDGAALGEPDSELLEQARALGAEEAHGQQHQVGVQRELAARDGREVEPPALADQLHADPVQPADVPVGVAGEALGRHGVDALAALLVGRGDPEDIGPLGPGIVRSAAVGWPRQQLELVHGARALAMHGPEAVGAGVAAADDHDVLAAGGDEPVVGDRVALAALVLERQVLHREVDAPERAPRDREIPRPAGAAGEDDRVEVSPDLRDRHVGADVGARPEEDALLLQDLKAAVEDALFHLELGDAVAEEASDTVVALEHRDPVPGRVELGGGREPGRPRAHDGDLLARADGGRGRLDPARLESVLDDAELDLLDRDGIVVDPEDARPLAGRRAEPARPFREVVGRVQALDRVAPVVAVDEVVPVGDDVAERAALVAEGDAAVHAPRPLRPHLSLGERKIDLPPVADPLLDRAARRSLAPDLEEARDLTHWWLPRARRT